MGEVINLEEQRCNRRPVVDADPLGLEVAASEVSGVIAAAELFEPLDVYATAKDLIANRETFEVAPVPRQERRDNARTAVFEALTASGHLSTVEIHGATIDDIHRQVMSRLLRGWSENLPSHEKHRRFLEICEAIIVHRMEKAIVAGELPRRTELCLISDYPTNLMNKSAARLGYRYKNRKGMVRSNSLRQNPDRTYTRKIEQISRSNGTQKSTFGFLRASGIRVRPGDRPDLVALDSPVLYTREDLANGVVDVQRHLDYCAGTGIMYGDSTAERPDHVPYKLLRQESARRERDVEHRLDDIAALEARLDYLVASGEITQRQKDNHYNQRILQAVREICVLRPQYAADTFGQKAAAFYYRASDLVAAGRFAEAELMVEAGKDFEEEIIICGFAISEDRAKELGVGLEELAAMLENGAESMAKSIGVCRVPNCPSKKKPTEVGPCNVCMRCQAKFDAGNDDSNTFYPPAKQTFAEAYQAHAEANRVTAESTLQEAPLAA